MVLVKKGWPLSKAAETADAEPPAAPPASESGSCRAVFTWSDGVGCEGSAAAEGSVDAEGSAGAADPLGADVGSAPPPAAVPATCSSAVRSAVVVGLVVGFIPTVLVLRILFILLYN